MTPETQASGAALEIVQSRALTRAEAMQLTRAVTRCYMRGFKREAWYWPVTVLKCGGLGGVIGIALLLSSRFGHQPEIYWSAVASFLCFIFGSGLFYRIYLRFIARANGAGMPAGSRHVLDAQGYTVTRGAQLSFLPWQSILSIEDRAGLTLISTSAVSHWPIISAAFDGATGADFTAELQRRWQQAKAA